MASKVKVVKSPPMTTGVTSDMLKKAGIIREMTRVFRNIVDKKKKKKEAVTMKGRCGVSI